MINWLSKLFVSSHAVILAELEKSKQNNKEMRALVNTFKAELGVNDDNWFCECFSHTKLKEKHVPTNSLCNTTPKHHIA